MIINIDRSNLLADIEYRPRQTIICLCVIGDRDKEWVTLFNCGIQVPCTGEREREKERERERQRERQRQSRDRDRERQRQRDRERQRQTETETERQAGRQTQRDT